MALNKGRMGDSTGDFEVQVTFETSSSNGVKIKYVSLCQKMIGNKFHFDTFPPVCFRTCWSLNRGQ